MVGALHRRNLKDAGKVIAMEPMGRMGKPEEVPQLSSGCVRMRLPSSPDTRCRLMAGLWYRSGVQLASTIPSYKGNLPCAINVTIPIKSMSMLCRPGVKL